MWGYEHHVRMTYMESDPHRHPDEVDLCAREGEAGQEGASAGSKLRLLPRGATGLLAAYGTCPPNFGLSKAVAI